MVTSRLDRLLAVWLDEPLTGAVSGGGPTGGCWAEVPFGRPSKCSERRSSTSTGDRVHHQLGRLGRALRPAGRQREEALAVYVDGSVRTRIGDVLGDQEDVRARGGGINQLMTSGLELRSAQEPSQPLAPMFDGYKIARVHRCAGLSGRACEKESPRHLCVPVSAGVGRSTVWPARSRGRRPGHRCDRYVPATVRDELVRRSDVRHAPRMVVFMETWQTTVREWDREPRLSSSAKPGT